jgi:putative peptidoglycan lipid II flippase
VAEDESERASIGRRAGVVLAGTLASRVLGAARDAVIAATFAVGATDAFFVAFTIPNALRVLLGEGAASGAFVPVYSEARQKEGVERAKAFYARLVGAMGLVLLGVTVVGVLAAPAIVTLYAGGYDAERFDATVLLTRIVFPYIFLMGLAALATGALHSHKHFATPAFAPALLNVALIAAPFVFVGFAEDLGLPGVAALAIGALVGGVLHVAAQLRALRSIGLLTGPRFDLSDPYVRKAFKLLVPLLAGLGVYQLNVMLSRLFASFLPEGAQSFLYYSQRVVEIPQGMFALAVATAALPTLADLRAREQHEELRRTFGYGLRMNLFLAIPATVALSVLASPTITVLFGRGSFEASYVAETARALLYMAIGVWAIASVRTVVPMFHAYNDTKTPVIASAVNLVVFTGLCFALLDTMEHAGIALAISAAGAAQLVTLLALLRRRAGRLGLRSVAASSARIATASAAMGGSMWAIARYGAWERGGNDPTNIAVYLAALAAGALVFLAAAKLLRAPELGELMAIVRRRAQG